MRARLALLALALSLGGASAQSLAPFLPPAAPTAKLVQVLTPPDFLDRGVIAAFEKDSGLVVALDTYAGAQELAQRNAERRYDLVVLNGPALARRLASLAPIDRRRLANARLVQPLVAAKFAAYDRQGARSVPFGWSAFGLLYDADKTPEAPVSWAQAIGAGSQHFGGCGVVWPDAREESFLAVWALSGVDAARARPADVKTAAARLERALGTFIAFAAPDEVGALAKGAACLGAGAAGEAAAVAARGGDNAPAIRFAYPREGAPLTLYAFAIPANAPSTDSAYRLLDALLAPDNERRDALSAGVNGAEEPTDLDVLRRLVPEPSLDPAVAAAMQSEWKRLSAVK